MRAIGRLCCDQRENASFLSEGIAGPFSSGAGRSCGFDSGTAFSIRSPSSAPAWLSAQLRTLRRIGFAAVAFFLMGLPILAQTSSATDTTTSCPAELTAGVVVESVPKIYESEMAGLTAGDIILTWSRGDAKGQISSPFDLDEVLTEQGLRGHSITLGGTRSGAKQEWVLGLLPGGIQVRPSLPPTLLAIYHDGQELTNAARFKVAEERWRASAAEGRKYQCVWLIPWLFFHAAEALTPEKDWTESDPLYQAALESAADVRPEVKVRLLYSWANTFYQRGDFANAEKYYQQALKEINATDQETLAAADVLHFLGVVAIVHGELTEAEEYLRQAYTIAEKLAPGSLESAVILESLGSLAAAHGDTEKAAKYNDQALEIVQQFAAGRPLDVNSLRIRAGEAIGRGDLTKAEGYFRQLLEILERTSKDSLDVGACLVNLGGVVAERGDLAAAEEYVLKAHTIFESLSPGSSAEAASLNGLGVIAEQRGDLPRAESYYRKSMVINKNLSPGGIAVAQNLDNLGNIAMQMGDPAQAEEDYRTALEIQVELAVGSLDVARSLHSLGIVTAARGYSAQAEEYYRQAQDIYERIEPGSLDEAETISNRAGLALDRNDLERAEQYFRQALSIRKSLSPDSRAYAESLLMLAGILWAKGEAEEAARLFGEALNVLDSQLAHLGGSSEVRAGFRARYADLIRLYVDLLLAQKKPEFAFQVLERSRARTLLELLAEAHVDIHQGVPPALLEQERVLQATLTAKSNRKINLLEGKHTDEQLAEVNKEMAAVLEQYQGVEAQIRSSSPAYAALTQPQPLSTREVQEQLLDPGTVLLEYALGEKRSFVFLVTPTSVDAYELPKRPEVEERAHRVYSILTSPNRWIDGETATQRIARIARDKREYQTAIAALSQMILGPVAAKIKGKRLVIVADGALQYIPFAALPEPGSAASKRPVPLIAEHEIVNLPSASVLALLRQQTNGRAARPKQVAVFADPVFDKDDPRVNRGKLIAPTESAAKMNPATFPLYQLTRSVGDVIGETRAVGSGLPRLVFSRQEATAIMALTSHGEGLEALDFQASRDLALSKVLDQYRIVHFATHGLLDNEHPELSGLVLSLVDSRGKPQNGFLELQDVYNMDLPVDLVVLSACETGLGKEINGEGLVGLTRGFMYAGAPRVVASLWKVDDLATADLMGRFYKAMLKDGTRPAAALRQAQLEMWKDKRWTDPYYWAAFTIQGEWK